MSGEDITLDVMKNNSRTLIEIVKKESSDPVGSARAAEALLLRLSDKGPAMSAAGYNALANAFSELGSPLSAEYWLDRTLEANLIPEPRTYVKVVLSLLRVGEMSRANYWAKMASSSSSVGLELFQKVMELAMQRGKDETQRSEGESRLLPSGENTEKEWEEVFKRQAQNTDIVQKSWRRNYLKFGIPILLWTMALRIPKVWARRKKNSFKPVVDSQNHIDLNQASNLKFSPYLEELASPLPFQKGNWAEDLNFADFNPGR
eukprot:CAMPEP_0184486108 /NCGR_PEP_ID=MMETSP0113_2-20130426/7663_1 /TAXON_ID=91329 /ORGANISM="Norrisiella sphaerica, Strain BC52" /LENGTH=260 /DNA_ID=CAMNT_0026867847 /DNA_START=89 /DNA_END=871 /DNA_ORIENTATION=-